MLKRMLLPALCLTCWPGWGQDMPGPSQAALDDAIRLGTLATLAPLCGIRDETWSFDLRRATVMDVTRAPHPDDEALQRAPGRDMVVGALSHAEAEALESFAEGPPADTCGPLTHDPGFDRADRMVRAFQLRKAEEKPSS